MILAGDIGGTKTRLALSDDVAAPPRFERRYASGAYPALEPILDAFLADARATLGGTLQVQASCFGIAGPVQGRRVRVTNLPWTIDADLLAQAFGIGPVRLLNDFAAAAYGIETLAVGELATLQAGEPLAGAPRVVLGAGTGLGVAYVVHGIAGYRALSGEGGHTGFAPRNADEIGLWHYLHERVGRVTLEHVLSGAGLMGIYDFLLERGTHPESPALRAELAEGDVPAAVTRAALAHHDPLAGAALDLFIACYGAAAGDHALNVMARGGIYVAGGIAPKILPRLGAGGFIEAFNDKANFTDAAQHIPVHVVTNERLPLMGAARAAIDHNG